MAMNRDYEIVTARNLTELEEAVNARLRKLGAHWQCQGGVVVLPPVYAQAMIWKVQ